MASAQTCSPGKQTPMSSTLQKCTIITLTVLFTASDVTVGCRKRYFPSRSSSLPEDPSTVYILDRSMQGDPPVSMSQELYKQSEMDVSTNLMFLLGIAQTAGKLVPITTCLFYTFMQWLNPCSSCPYTLILRRSPLLHKCERKHNSPCSGDTPGLLFRT